MTRVLFVDTETTSLDERTGDMWELGLILRDLRQPATGDLEFWWQIRPDLTHAEPTALRIGRYYERSRVTTVSMGKGKRLSTTVRPPQGGGWIHAYTGEPPVEGDYYISMTAADIAEQLARQLDGATIVANNPTHDRKFLAKFLRANGQILTAHHRMLNIRDLLIGYIEGRLSMTDGDIREAFEPHAAGHVFDWVEGADASPAWEISA